MTIDVTGVLVILAIAAALLAVLPGYRITAIVAAAGLTLLCALAAVLRPAGTCICWSTTFIVLSYLRRLHDEPVQRELYRP